MKVLGPAIGATVTEGGVLKFSAEVSNGIPPYAVTWSFGGAAADASGLVTNEILMEKPGTYTAQVKIQDSASRSGVASVGFTVSSVLENMKVWFGNLHSHTGASDGEGTPAEAFAWARDEANLDFYVVTDHAELLSRSEWDETGAAASQFNQPGSFAALRGFEWSHPWFGHLCVYTTSSFKTAQETLLLNFIYDWIDKENALVQFNHPGREPGMFNWLAYTKSVADNMFAIETGNKDKGNSGGEFVGHYVEALDKGWRVAPTNNQDNHSLSTNSHRTAYLGPELSAEGLLEAMRARRIYSTDDPNIEVAFRAGPAWMGSSVPVAKGPLSLTVKVADDEPIVSIRILTNKGKEAAIWTPLSDNVTSTLWRPDVAVEPGDYLFVEVTSKNEKDGDDPQQIALTAPLWIE